VSAQEEVVAGSVRHDSQSVATSIRTWPAVAIRSIRDRGVFHTDPDLPGRHLGCAGPARSSSARPPEGPVRMSPLKPRSNGFASASQSGRRRTT